MQVPVRLSDKRICRWNIFHKAAAQQINAIIKKYDDWRGEMLSRLRALIKQADPALVEEVKWKKPSRPEGVPVWSHDGILCFCDTIKEAALKALIREAVGLNKSKANEPSFYESHHL